MAIVPRLGGLGFRMEWAYKEFGCQREPGLGEKFKLGIIEYIVWGRILLGIDNPQSYGIYPRF